MDKVTPKADIYQANLDRAAPLLTDTTMRTLNNQIDGKQKREPADVARDFIKAHGLVSL